ncbi:MAG: efflux RND transporter periplasmic adaptor subunit [bacterium]|nr:efflux RND transporter periplasmic adaptor subunit [bacterium]
MKRMLEFFRKPLGIIVIIVAVVIGAVFFFNRPQAPKYDFVVAQKRDLIQEVSVTGRVKPAESVNLAFEKSGKVKQVLKEVGQKVTAGSALVILNSAELASQLSEAEANVRVQQAKLDELKQGTRPEEIQAQEIKVAGAKVALDDAKQNLADKLQDAFTKADDAVRNKVDQFFTNPRTTSPQAFQYLNINSQLKNDLEWDRVLIENILNNWQDSSIEVAADLSQIQSFLDKAGLAVNSASANQGLSQATLDSWKTDVATARANINTAINNLTLADEKLKNAESDLASQEQELILEKAGTIAEKIIGQEAQVEQARAQVENLKIQISKATLFAPISGVISRQDAKVGEIVSANVSIVSLISESQFEIEADVPEADIAKIKTGDGAKITLDAYGNEVIFQGKVVSIDPAEKIIEGVATYKTKVQFLEKDERVKSGMTANVDITGSRKEGVVAIPQRVVITRNGDRFVNILEAGKISEKKIITGFRGSDGFVEIIDGIKEGDKIIISSK